MSTESDLQSTDSSSLTPYYDYCSVTEGNRTPSTQPEEALYATLTNVKSHHIENARVGPYDYTVIYDDPTSLSYVVSVQIVTSYIYVWNLCFTTV